MYLTAGKVEQVYLTAGKVEQVNLDCLKVGYRVETLEPPLIIRAASYHHFLN